MTKKLIFGFGICGLLILGLILGLAWMHGQIRGLTEIIYGQEIRIMGAEKQIPNVVRYTNIVRELTEKGKDKLTAFEIVEMARIIIIECQEHSDISLTPDLIFGLIERESAFNPKAFSPARAYGLMQPIQGTFEFHLPALGHPIFSEELAYNPIVNLQVGIAEMVRLRQTFGEWEKALTAYFWGERLTAMLLESKKRDFLPSLEYGRGVLKLAEQYKSRGIL
jgi:hypothetical protein